MQVQIPTVEAIPLVFRDEETSHYKTNADALIFLSRIPSPMAVISMVGLYRTGKSYLLNKMILNKKEGGFNVGSTINACTKGLWIWPEIVKGRTAEGKDVNIVVIDTEGIGSLEEDSTHDIKVFSLAILLSSCFIYTSVGAIETNSIQNLSLVVHLTQLITRKMKTEIEAPQFLWILRDFSLLLTDREGNSLTTGEYLEQVLVEERGQSEDVFNRNQIRKCVKSFFIHRECVAFQRPLTCIDGNLMDIPLQQLKPEFVETMFLTRNRLLTRSNVKKVGDREVDGKILTLMVEKYTQAVNGGQVPDILGAWEYINRELEECALRDTIETIQTEIDEIPLPASNDDLLKKLHSLSEKSAKRVESFSKPMRLQFSHEFQKRKQNIVAKNTETSKQLLLRHLGQKSKRLDVLKSSNVSHLKDFQHQLEEFQLEVKDELKSYQLSNSREVLTEWKLKQYEEQWTFIYKVMENKINSEVELNRSMGELYKEEVTRLKQEIRAQKEQSTREITDLRNQKLKLQCQLSADRERGQKEGRNELGPSLPFGEITNREEVDKMRKEKSGVEERLVLVSQDVEFWKIRNSELEIKIQELKKSETHYLNIIQNSSFQENRMPLEIKPQLQTNTEDSIQLKDKLTRMEEMLKVVRGEKQEIQLKHVLLTESERGLSEQLTQQETLWKSKEKDYTGKLEGVALELSQEKELCRGYLNIIEQLKEEIVHLESRVSERHPEEELEIIKSYYQQERALKSKSISEYQQYQSQCEQRHSQDISSLEQKYLKELLQLNTSNNGLLQQISLLQKDNQDLSNQNRIMTGRGDHQREQLSQNQHTIITLEKTKSEQEAHLQSLKLEVMELKEVLMSMEKSHEHRVKEVQREAQLTKSVEDKRLKDEILRTTHKLEKLEQCFDSQEKAYLKQISEDHTKTAAMIQRYSALQHKQKEKENTMEMENQRLTLQAQNLTQKLRVASAQFQRSIEELESNVTQLETEKEDIENNYDRDMVLWKGKIDFLEQQKKSQRTHYQDKITKLEQTIEFINKNPTTDPLSNILTSATNKYTPRVNRQVSVSFENEGWQNEIHDLKRQKEKLQVQYQKSINSEKEMHSLKIKEMEQRVREAEHRKETLLNFHQEERNSWNQERTSFIKTKRIQQEIAHNYK